MMEKEFASYKQSVALKELGFNEKCFTEIEYRKICEEQSKPNGCQLHNLHCGYPDCTIDRTKSPVGMPLKQQVFRWFREKYGDILLYHYGRVPEFTIMQNILLDTNCTYEEAENACIDKLIELAKQQDNEK